MYTSLSYLRIAVHINDMTNQQNGSTEMGLGL